MSKILYFSGGMFYNKQLNASTYVTLLGLFLTISLRKINQDNLNEPVVMVCPSLNNNTRTGLVISLCLNTNPLMSLIPPNRLKF